MEITVQEKKVFDYLNELQEGGSVNMFVAGHSIEVAFGYNKYTAANLLSKWMRNFNPNGYEDLVIADKE